MQRIEPVIRDYAWGSRTALATLGGRETPSAEPEAELWVGAHEGSPARVPELDCGLDEHIAIDREAALGEAGPRFAGRLPFLLKILAAEKALSIQAHPDADRAQSAPDGVYGDNWPKPEAWVPLEECEAFIGSLPFEEAATRLRALEISALAEFVDRAGAEHDPSHALLSAILRTPAAEQPVLVEAVVEALGRELRAGDIAADVAQAWACILRVHEQFPGDIGIVVLLTMEYQVLHPGSSSFLAAGVLHTFVRGTAIEILANSDNVVRAGLTGKAIDIDELLAIVDLSARVSPEEPELVDGRRTYPSRAEHFTLHEIRPNGRSVTVPGDGAPTLCLALDGPVTLVCGHDELELLPLEAAWISASDATAVVRGTAPGRIFVATPGR